MWHFTRALTQRYARILLISVIALLSACGNSPDRTANTATNTLPPNSNGNCANPMPREVKEFTATSPVQNSLDPQRTGGTNANTAFQVAVFLPERCPGDTFPVIMESHGYSGMRENELDDDGEVPATDPHFPSLDTFIKGIAFHGYVGVSFDERGHGDSTPNDGGGYARGIDPEAETQDAIALLNTLYERREEFFIQDQTPITGIPKDIPIGLIGGSYGGAYQMVLAALDERIDTIVPNGTWHNLLHSLLPGDAVKLGFAGLLCLLADQGGVVNSPVFAETCEAVSYDQPQARDRRTRADLAAAVGAAAQTPPITEDEVIELFGTHGMNYFQQQQAAGQPAISAQTDGPFSTQPFVLRSVPSLFLQGNRDVLFNMTEAYWNWSYFKSAAAAGVPVKILTTEGTHMNPLANQVEAPANCGPIIGIPLLRAWYDFHLKGIDSPTYQNIPEVCISVTDTDSAHTATPVSVTLNDMPIGSQTGAGAVPAVLATANASVADINTGPTFLPVVTISGNNQVLAGIPQIESLTVSEVANALPAIPGAPVAADVTAIAYIGVGINRGGSVFLVDEQLGAFLEGTHTENRNIGNTAVLLPGVGEQLQDGDEVGLLLYENHVQYSALIDFSTAGGGTGLTGFVTGVELPPLLDPASPLFATFQHSNPYTVDFTNIELPIFDVTAFPGAQLRQ